MSRAGLASIVWALCGELGGNYATHDRLGEALAWASFLPAAAFFTAPDHVQRGSGRSLNAARTPSLHFLLSAPK